MAHSLMLHVKDVGGVVAIKKPEDTGHHAEEQMGNGRTCSTQEPLR